MAAPARESEALALEARRDVARDQRGLDAERARAAHRIDEAERRAVRRRGRDERRPARAEQDRGGEVLLERRGALRSAIAAPVQALAREIDRERRDVAVEMQVHAHVGRSDVDRRPHAGRLAELIDDRVLDLERGELRVGDRGAAARAVDRERAVHAEVRAPVDLAHAVVERVGRRRVELSDLQQHAARDARPEACAIRVLERRFARDAAARDLRRRDAE